MSPKPKPDHVTEQSNGTINVGKDASERLNDRAQKRIKDARAAEQQVNKSNMNPTDKMMYNYLQAIVALLEDQSDISVDRN